MRGTFRRTALLGCSGLALAAFAPAAQAAGPVTTLPATGVTTNSANIWGKIDTGGQTARYQFQYGTSPAYQFSTASQTIAPGQGQTFVEASILRLRPNTTYHFRVWAVFFGIGGNYQEAKAGDDLTFTTKPIGRLALLKPRVPVAGGLAKVGLRCRSQAACKGSFSITTHRRIGKTRTTVVCAARAVRIRAGKKRTFLARLRPACRSLLQASPNHVRQAQFTSMTQTGQRGAQRAIKLTG